jgi:prepilin-type N-terminal cleavage/methylation domain-containing protein
VHPSPEPTRAVPSPARRAAIRRAASSGGFTLIELLVVLILLGIITTLGFPALQNMIARSRLEGTVRQMGVLIQQARYEAIKNSTPVSVRIDIPGRMVTAFRDSRTSGDMGTQDAGELAVGGEGGLPLPRLIDFAAPGAETVVDGFDGDADHGWLTFSSDGSVDKQGAFRIGDNRGNYLEIAVEPAATARIEMRKWDDSTSAFVAQGTGGKPWTWN